MPQSFKEFVGQQKGWSIDEVVDQLGYSSYYHLDKVLKSRSQLLSDLCEGILLNGGVPESECSIVAMCKEMKIPISRIARFWGVSREYICRSENSKLLCTAFLAGKPRALANVEMVRLPVNVKHYVEVNNKSLKDELKNKRSLWTMIDCLAWWSPPDNRVQVRGIYGAFQGDKGNGPLIYMLMDSINGLPIAPPDFKQYGNGGERLMSAEEVKKSLKSKGWSKSDLCERWNFKDITHLYKTLGKCTTHPHISDAIRGLPPLIKANRIVK